MNFLVKEGRLKIYAFVIMPNHIHIVWHLNEHVEQAAVQRDFLKFTAQKIKFDLTANHPSVLERFKVSSADRKHQIWERNPKTINLYSWEIIGQKLVYIHNNPLQEHWKLVPYPEDYYFSSVRFYNTGIDDFGFLSRYLEG